jgi:hypothetical protein
MDFRQGSKAIENLVTVGNEMTLYLVYFIAIRGLTYEKSNFSLCCLDVMAYSLVRLPNSLPIEIQNKRNRDESNRQKTQRQARSTNA